MKKIILLFVVFLLSSCAQFNCDNWGVSCYKAAPGISFSDYQQTISTTIYKSVEGSNLEHPVVIENGQITSENPIFLRVDKRAMPPEGCVFLYKRIVEENKHRVEQKVSPC